MYKISLVTLSLGALLLSERSLIALSTDDGSPVRRPARPRPSALDAKLKSAQLQHQQAVTDPASCLHSVQIEELIRRSQEGSQKKKRPEPLKLDKEESVKASAKIPDNLYLLLLGALHKEYVSSYLQHQAAGILENESSLRSLQKLMEKKAAIDPRVTAVPSRSVLPTYNGSTALEARKEDPDASGALIRYSFLITLEGGNPTVLRYVIQDDKGKLVLIEPSF